MTEPLAAAQLVVADFPAARAAFLGRSVLSKLRNATSDLDILIVQDRPHSPNLQRIHRYGWPVELFVHTESSLRQHWALDVQARRQALLRVSAEGASILTDTELFDSLQTQAQELVRTGPRALDLAEVEQRRFVISDLIDDLEGCVVRCELSYIANALLLQIANLVLMAGGHWTGSSKWLGRELADFSPTLADELYDAHRLAVGDGEIEPLSSISRRVLDSVGGPFPAEFFARLTR